MATQPGGPEPGSWRDRLARAAQFAARRLAGAYEVDQFGFDAELNSAVLMPAALTLYRQWFRIQMRGLDAVPAAGAALVVANHSGVLPVDAVMLQAGLFADHPAHRNLRLLGGDLVYQLPGLGPLARRSGHARADPACAGALLAAGEVVGVFPEGYKGTGKPFRERYQLQRFGRGGFARTAIAAGVPIIPCAIVGAEEIYPMIANSRRAARLLGLPYFPVTPLFPWLGPLGAVPLPSRWIIEFGPPVPTAGLGGDGADALAAAVRDTIQARVDALVAERGPAFG
ncbi:MAG TPA: lysophospholipid acyltransferase family protein [Streptosporangiaceae bacterium]